MAMRQHPAKRRSIPADDALKRAFLAAADVDYGDPSEEQIEQAERRSARFLKDAKRELSVKVRKVR